MDKKPLIIGHRGARKYAPENTISSFRKAVELELDGVEFDVISTSDGVPVVCHDNNLQRLSGRHIHVDRTPYSELKHIDVGSHFNQYFAGESIPTLEDALKTLVNCEMLPGHKRPLCQKFFINIELKEQSHQPQDFIANVVDVIDRYRNRAQISVSSFSRAMLFKTGNRAPHIDRALLIRPKIFYVIDAVFFANILGVRGINPHVTNLNRRLVNYAHSRKMSVMAWTINDAAQVKKALDVGSDGIITDDPLFVKEVVKNHNYG